MTRTLFTKNTGRTVINLFAALVAVVTLSSCGSGGPLSVAEKGDGRGIGGTGLVADRGIGGTGVIGTVTGFGSIWVNGLEIEIDPNMEITGSRKGLTIGEVSIGHVVEVLARTVKGKLTAQRIRLRAEVVGPVQSISSAQTDIIVAGQSVRLGTAHAAHGLTVGNQVSVYGIRRSDGVIEASLIEPAPDLLSVQVRGRVSRSTDGIARVGIIEVPVDLPTGTLVDIRARVQGDRITEATVSRAHSNPFGRDVERLSVERFLNADGDIPGLTVGDLTTRPASPLGGNRKVIVDYQVTAGRAGAVRSVISADLLGGRPADETRAPSLEEDRVLQDRLNQIRDRSGASRSRDGQSRTRDGDDRGREGRDRDGGGMR